MKFWKRDESADFPEVFDIGYRQPPPALSVMEQLAEVERVKAETGIEIEVESLPYVLSRVEPTPSIGNRAARWFRRPR
ncbi:hypothetical protein [Citricoccus nitrophenolicus]|uniref:hypothetical protein n=1 Tax=Citricoccus nitrophenolicus TaxID=863575 RepID=UPI0031E7D619